MDKLIEKCLLTNVEMQTIRNEIIRYVALGSNTGMQALSRDTAKAQLLKAIPIISEEVRVEERRDYEHKLTLKEEVVTKRVAEEIKRELEEEFGVECHISGEVESIHIHRGTEFNRYQAFWKDRGVK